ncbi:MAG: GGDEF domain-containing protein [Butyrivibrio sp.]|nr:GGDEF domain-containing protein [Acetatifactor muris]MCM1560130.1 GGDEF domain-containing protein [Butyrivibrio sp.]
MLALIKTPITCLLFMIYMTCFYYRKPHIPVKSTQIFQRLIIAALVNAVFDLVTVYTVNHPEQVPGYINLIVHIIYLLSILAFIYLLFLYLRSFLEANLKLSGKLRILQNLPAVLSTAGILLLPITYVQGKTTNYALGAKAYALYGSVAIYLLLILYYCIRYRGILDREKRMAILLAVPLFVATAAIQMAVPETLVVVVCSTLILLGLILSNENSEKYIDEQTMLFNQYSLERVLEEFDFDRQRPVVAVFCFCRTESSRDWNRETLILEDIYRELKQYRVCGYRVCENGVVFISSAGGKARTLLERVRVSIEGKYGKESIGIETKVLAGEAVATEQICMRNIVAFCTETGSRLAYIDYLTNLYNRNALERDLKKWQEYGYTCYLIADLNNLKKVNDAIGHSAGDKLLQDFAMLLTDAVGEGGRAYRQGGDEFTVLYGGDALQLMQSLEQRCEKHNRFCAVPVSYAIGYCLLEDENFRDVADQMMYADKKRKKGQ